LRNLIAEFVLADGAEAVGGSTTVPRRRFCRRFRRRGSSRWCTSPARPQSVTTFRKAGPCARRSRAARAADPRPARLCRRGPGPPDV